jgi:hypothetical protein
MAKRNRSKAKSRAGRRQRRKKSQRWQQRLSWPNILIRWREVSHTVVLW